MTEVTEEMNYANHIGWSDVNPYEIIRRTPKTLVLREMDAKLDPEWKPEMHAGGFAAHCSNQRSQKWIITSNPKNPEIRAYLRKDGNYHSRHGKHKVSNTPIKFYDYNF